MFEELFFWTGIANSVLLIIIFSFRRAGNMKAMKICGYIYFLLAIPAIYAIILGATSGKPFAYTVFLGIFIAYLVIECIYDFILKIDFRKKWYLLAPYLLLFIPMNYGFIVMPWKESLVKGVIMAGLFIIQTILNLVSHRALATKETSGQ